MGTPKGAKLTIRNPSERFFEKVEKTDSCWIWKGNLNPMGYGRFTVRYSYIYAHRFSYELVNGPIQEGMQIDHLCRNTSCVNPFHLDAVSAQMNNSRSTSPSARNKIKTHCKNGHIFNLQNTYINPDGDRECRECRKLSTYKSKERRNSLGQNG